MDVLEKPIWTVTLAGLAATLKLGGLNGRRLVNLTIAGVEVPSAYNRSSVGLDPVGLRLMA